MHLKTRFLQALLLTALCLPAAKAQEVKKEVLDHIRSVSVTIEVNGKPIGSGTIFDKDGETWVITANHVVARADGEQIRVTQHKIEAGAAKVVSVNAEVFSQCENTDVAILKVGKGVFGPGAKFYRDCCQPDPTTGEKGDPPGVDTPIVHCGSPRGLHHTVSRGYIVGLNRDARDHLENGPEKADQADITAYYGSSGGGVFLTDGRFIGMAFAGYPQRIIFFVPIRRIKLD